MDGGGHIAVYGCSNHTRREEKAIVTDHVGTLRLYSPKYKEDLAT